MTNLATTLAQTTARYPDRAAVCMDERVLRYRDLDETSARAVSWLSGRGIGPGDRVGLMLPNTPEFPQLYYGILRAGAIVVPMNPLLKSREVAYHLTDSSAALVLAGMASPIRRARARGLGGPGDHRVEELATTLCQLRAGCRDADGWVRTAAILYTWGPPASRKAPSSPTTPAPATWRSPEPR
jgi:long-chain acyl-CoA synthetase